MLVIRRGRPRRDNPEKPGPAWEVVDPDFDDGADEAIALLRYEIETHGAAPLHPDDNRITTYDPVPLCAGDDRKREEPKTKRQKGPTEDERRAAEQIITWLAAVAPRPVTIEERQVAPRLPQKPRSGSRAKYLGEPIVELLPAGFKWLLDNGHCISQAEVERFWIEHRLRNFAFRTIRVLTPGEAP